MMEILREESMTLYKDKNVFTAVVFAPGSSVAFGQVALMISPVCSHGVCLSSRSVSMLCRVWHMIAGSVSAVCKETMLVVVWLTCTLSS